MNFASFSLWERFGWGPFTLVLLMLSVVLARSGVAPGRPPRGTRDHNLVATDRESTCP